jgi:hypothetical protein
MNYFAHGRLFIDDPYFLAGTALPDWLQVSDRGVRVRPKHVEPFVAADDPQLAALARGVMQHHADDAWFHASRAFFELSTDFTLELRAILPADSGFRASFVGHVLVELLLDDALIAGKPELLDAYYDALAAVDRHAVQEGVGRIAPRQPERLAWFIERFLAERFLSDYADDGKLLVRLNQVMRRVRLPPLPEAFLAILPAARQRVAERREELIRKL